MLTCNILIAARWSRVLQKFVDIPAIIQFRQSLSCLNAQFPFSLAFGRTDTREQCIDSATTVYHRLLSGTPGSSVVSFGVLALITVKRDGSIDEEKLAHLVQLFRPDRQGVLTQLDFAKSIDTVYKDLRLLRASVASSSKMDQAFENVINIAFYVAVGSVVLLVIGVSPLALFATVSTFVLAFAFAIRDASSKYFEVRTY
jgi:hypothetical protein